MSITTMTNQEKATQNPAAATEAPVKTEVAHCACNAFEAVGWAMDMKKEMKCGSQRICRF
eukprot:scaffold15736_cov75-Skeletonema_marinoi.AAC.2